MLPGAGQGLRVERGALGLDCIPHLLRSGHEDPKRLLMLGDAVLVGVGLQRLEATGDPEANPHGSTLGVVAVERGERPVDLSREGCLAVLGDGEAGEVRTFQGWRTGPRLRARDLQVDRGHPAVRGLEHLGRPTRPSSWCLFAQQGMSALRPPQAPRGCAADLQASPPPVAGRRRRADEAGLGHEGARGRGGGDTLVAIRATAECADGRPSHQRGTPR